VEVYFVEIARLAETTTIQPKCQKVLMQQRQPIFSRPCPADSDTSQSISAKRLEGLWTSEELTKLHCLCIPLPNRWKFLLSRSTMSLSAKP